MTDRNDNDAPRGVLIRSSRVPEYLGLPASSFHEIAKRPDFPRKLRLGLRTVAYKRCELDQWLETCRDPKPSVAQE